MHFRCKSVVLLPLIHRRWRFPILFLPALGAKLLLAEAQAGSYCVLSGRRRDLRSTRPETVNGPSSADARRGSMGPKLREPRRKKLWPPNFTPQTQNVSFQL